MSGEYDDFLNAVLPSGYWHSTSISQPQLQNNTQRRKYVNCAFYAFIKRSSNNMFYIYLRSEIKVKTLVKTLKTQKILHNWNNLVELALPMPIDKTCPSFFSNLK